MDTTNVRAASSNISLGRALRPSSFPPTLEADNAAKRKKLLRRRQHHQRHPWLTPADMDSALADAQAAGMSVTDFLAQKVLERKLACVKTS